MRLNNIYYSNNIIHIYIQQEMRFVLKLTE